MANQVKNWNKQLNCFEFKESSFFSRLNTETSAPFFPFAKVV